jgi:hypothetical protein
VLGTRALPDVPELGEVRRPDMALLQGAEGKDVGLGAVRGVPGLSGEKIATLRMIDALCDGNLNSEARRYWTCEALAFQAAWASDPGMGPFLTDDEREQLEER